MNPQNGIIGDAGADQYGTELPQTQQPEADLQIERNMARFSQTDEFAKLKNVLDAKIEYYRHYMPGSEASPIEINKLPNEERGYMWLAADTIIREFQSLIDAYELAAQAVKDSDKAKATK